MNQFCSIFSQLLQLFPRLEFQQMGKETKAGRHARGFTCWSQFVSMLFCQLGRAHSLREISGGLRSCEGKLRHLGITAPSHSTLVYANEHRSWELYQHVFLKLFDRWTAQGVYFVTRMKENGLYEVVGEREVPKNRNLLKEELIELRGVRAIEKSPYSLRRIEAFDPETGKILVFLTSHLCLGATTIAAIYKDPNLDSIEFDADPEISSTSFPIQLVPFEFGGSIKNESLYPSRSLGLVK